ncbi:uncharacterized protein LOC119724685 [Patiria miniata]|uniref:Uncharacterized protein n=1 Tax=Patiria miniata TaxID=46514 RepID=A0A913ZJ04_PATMI|nr:uncharacterized protein LOC119724685 [Patiria miniata]XP_038051778.1 uncharacterized protein LOC119724685 [Patiria miniata]
MRDKQSPGDTYNYKEHVYADPVALRKEIEKDKQEKADKQKIKKYQKPSSPPPVPSGPRQGTGRNTLYAELAKKSNVPKSSVRDLGSLFGGTLPRAGSATTPEDSPPPPVPEVTESRNILDENNSTPGSPIKTLQSDTVMNILGACDDETPDSEWISAPVEGVAEPDLKEGPVANLAEGQVTEDSNTEPNGLEDESFGAPSPEPGAEEAEVVIDVRINSEAGIEIGAEIPTAADDADTPNDDDGGVRLIKSVKRDPFAVDTGDTGSAAANASTEPAGNSPAQSKQEHGSEAGSGSSGSTKRKKKDVESGFHPNNHLRRNLIIISLFLLIVLILVSIAIVILLNYTQLFK